MSLKPRHKKLISKVFPANPDDGLIKCRLDKLLLYASSKPDKFLEIAENFAQRINRDLYRHYRIGYILLSMEALYELLLASRVHGLHILTPTYLTVIKKLLDNNCIDLQVLATDYFIKFTYIDDDTQTYYDWYDLFVLRFKDMCYCKSATGLTKYRIRITGLRGIQGIIRKAINDEQELSIWQSEKIQKIVSSLLYNMHDASLLSPEQSYLEDVSSLSSTAEKIFSDLINHATFGTIKSILKPVLIHFDYHQLWVPNEFAVKAFKIIMNSIQSKYSYLVLQMLVYHMDNYIENEPVIKTNIIDVVFQNVLIASQSCVFPTMLEVFDSLLKHLKHSVHSDHSDWQYREIEETFQNTAANTICQIANRLTCYQKIDAMMFLLGKFPADGTGQSFEILQIIKLQKMILMVLHKISNELRFVVGMNAFSPEFLVLLLKVSQNKNPRFRMRVEQILHGLLDKHQNTTVLSKVCLLKDLSEIKFEITPRVDEIFMKKNGYIFYQHIYESIELENNDIENFEMIYCTMALIAVEFGCRDIIVDLYRLALDIQDMVTINAYLSTKHSFAVHSLIAAYMSLLSKLFFIAGIQDHISEIIELRSHEAKNLLPDFVYCNKSAAKVYPKEFVIDESLLFSRKLIFEYFQAVSAINVELNTSVRTKKSFSVDSTRSIMDMATPANISDSEFEQFQRMVQGFDSDKEFTFDAMKEVLTRKKLDTEDNDNDKRIQIFRKFKFGAFEDMVQTSKDKQINFEASLKKALATFTDSPDISLHVLLDKTLDPSYLYEDIQIPVSIY
ncbi:protein EFR3 homolog B-like isoform X2 [Octopus vulgaris]|uniref:Protein EFR3 homolog B-like isoform X2 n=1 Tax=Octopus vulgaris TaxID=6645 RepID=A0AA36FE74_OCTVU|nr:protein EFR3 homolog B-like isoform X2 [Octopus vulgaris]